MGDRTTASARIRRTHVRIDAALAAAARQGDERAAALVVDRCRRLVHARASAFYLRGADRDDVVQEGMLGLCKAIRDFDPQRGVDFSSFADVCIKRQLVTAVRASTRFKHRPLAHYASLNSEEAARWDARESTARCEDPGEQVVAAAALIEAVGVAAMRLSDLERDVLMHHASGLCYREIAHRVGRAVKSVDNALQRARSKVEMQVVAVRAL